MEKVIALVDRDVNLVAKSAFDMFKKIAERLDIVSGVIKNTIKTQIK